MRLHRKDTLELAFDTGVTLNIDLSSVEMSDEQREAVNRLAARVEHLDTVECADGECPAQRLLPERDFELVRNLKAQLGGGTVTQSGPIVDFCLDVIDVGKEPGRGSPAA